jgi:hypothetical protein
MAGLERWRRAVGFETTEEAYVQEFAERTWYTQLYECGRRLEDDVERRVEAVRVLLRPEATDVERAAALVVATMPMPPDLYREKVLMPLGLAERGERSRG